MISASDLRDLMPSGSDAVEIWLEDVRQNIVDAAKEGKFQYIVSLTGFFSEEFLKNVEEKLVGLGYRISYSETKRYLGIYWNER